MVGLCGCARSDRAQPEQLIRIIIHGSFSGRTWPSEQHASQREQVELISGPPEGSRARPEVAAPAHCAALKHLTLLLIDFQAEQQKSLGTPKSFK